MMFFQVNLKSVVHTVVKIMADCIQEIDSQTNLFNSLKESQQLQDSNLRGH